MKKIIIIAMMVIPLSLYAKTMHTIALENDNVIIIMNIGCNTTSISCDKINYNILDKKNSLRIDGKGKTINAGKAENFMGYQLYNGDLTYSLYETSEDDIWDLSIEKKYHEINKTKIKTVFDDGNY